MRIIPTEILRINSTNGKNIYNTNGSLLIKENATIGERELNILKKSNYLGVYVKDEYSKGEIQEMIPDILRNRAVMKLKKASSDFMKINASERMKKIMEDDMNEIIFIANEITEYILCNEITEIASIDVRNIENYDYCHSVNVAIMATVLGKSLKYEREELCDICLTGLLHDIGKAFIPREINLKKEKLTKEERKIFEDHSRLGFLYLNNYSNISREVKIAAFQHHERVDGKGYPNNVTGDKMDNFTKIITLVDSYDNMMTNRYKDRGMIPTDVVEYLLSHCEQSFDLEIVKRFANIIKPFSCGTLVKLSNNEIAAVEENNAGFPLRPKVKVIKGSKKDRNGTLIDLVNELNITIVDIVYYIN